MPVPKTDYRALHRSLVRRTLLVSVLPLFVIASANLLLFFFLNRAIVIEQHTALLRYHKESIEAFLKSLTSQVTTLAHQYSMEELRAGHLERVFSILRQQAGVITDIGIIDSQGDHAKYVGPYDLAGRNYRNTEWFRRVVERGSYVSDTFLGFRGIPHFIIAVKREEGEGFWILRATVNTDYFTRLVNAADVGRTGEVFIVNRQGLYQTRPKSGGELLSPSGFPDLSLHTEVRERTLAIDGKHYLCTSTWIRDPEWLLILRQETSDVYSPLRHSVIVGCVMTAIGLFGAGLLAIVVARAQVRRLQRADAEKELLTQRLVAAGKTAAVGEMSAGLAHEINNPLATIDALRTWIQDLTDTDPIDPQDRQEISESAGKIGEQVERCKTITQGLLKFARRVESAPDEIDVNAILDELVAVMRPRARIENVLLETSFNPIPNVFASPTHIQQIFVNLVNNAVDATAGRPEGLVRIVTTFDGGQIRVDVLDNGTGIDPEDQSRIFLPFFTTKPVGRGTGLGLAICYGLVQELHGSIRVTSTPGAGSTFTVLLPPAPAPWQRPGSKS